MTASVYDIFDNAIKNYQVKINDSIYSNVDYFL